MSQIRLLVKLQECDTDILRTTTMLEELPEAPKIMDCRARRRDIKGKQDQVLELSDETNAEVDKLQVKEDDLTAKINELQKQIDNTSDYRLSTSLTKDMESQVKCRARLGLEQNTLLDRQVKIEMLSNELIKMLKQLDIDEEELTEKFHVRGAVFRDHLDELDIERASLVEKIDPEMLERYERIRKEKHGIALGVLEECHCSVCRFTFFEGQMMNLQKGPAMIECPNCHRFLVIRQEDE